MREYKHTTRECRFEELKPEMVTAIREFCQKNSLLPMGLDTQVLVCIETVSEQVKIGFMDRLSGLSEKIYTTGALVTPEFIIWVTSGPKRKTSVLAARLVEVEITKLDYTGVRDSGLDLFGLMIGGKERITTYIALGNDPAAQKFERVFRAALDKAYQGGGSVEQ
jgi:hypothetical protein